MKNRRSQITHRQMKKFDFVDYTWIIMLLLIMPDRCIIHGKAHRFRL